MEDTQILNQDHEQQFQEVLNAIKDFNGKQVGTKEYNAVYRQLQYLAWGSLSPEEAEQIVNTMVEAEFKFDKFFLDDFFKTCGKEILNANCVKNILKTIDDFEFGINLLYSFLNACGENSLDSENLRIIARLCDEELFSFDNVNLIDRMLNDGCVSRSLTKHSRNGNKLAERENKRNEYSWYKSG